MEKVKKQIYCKGRWSVTGKIECSDKFQHIGYYGDQELIDHQEKEKSLNCMQNWWTGFEDDPKFDAIRECRNKLI
jgi:hypothetical protein